MAFKKGQSGNPKGRPVGVGLAGEIRQHISSNSKALIDKAIELALNGDTTALRLCIERVCPSIKSKDEAVVLGAMNGSLSEQGGVVIQSMAEGKITPSEATGLLGALVNQARICEVDEIESRLSKLEATNYNS
ncbi:MAG: hypothetical protein DRQ47_10575 [Gammaproteobacteria bacterium]|nr:MAG: hypothetical protein DRQ47_10575 [Gammaproteobacteria bacterium]